MKVSVEQLGPCKRLMRVEVDPEAVDAAYESATKDLVKRANLPGYRPGKAPRDLVVRAFGPQIEGEVKRKVIPEAYKRALEEQKLRPLTYPDVEEGVLEPGKPLSFTATFETEPDFEVPDYRGLPVRRERKVVTEEDVERAIRMLLDERSKFVDVARPVQDGDYVVVNYTGTCEGRPISEIAPTAQGLASQTKFWLHVDSGHFIPGFTDPLRGANAGDRRTVVITFPGDFVARELAGRVGEYAVEVLEVKVKEVPALTDDFAKSLGAANLEVLRVGIRADLERELKLKQKREVRSQLVATLLGRVQFDLPAELVQQETRSAVYDIVRANQERGVPKAAIDERKDEIYSVASNSARERVKVMFILRRIAEKEGIQVSDQEVAERVTQLAIQHQMRPDKLAKQLKEQGALGQIRQEISEAKVLDAIELYANVEEAPGS